MPKKLTIVSAIALTALAVVIAVLVKASAPEGASPPHRVSVYMPEEGEILTVEYAEFLAGCMTGALAERPYIDDEALTAVAAAMNSRAMCELAARTGFQNLGADFTAGGALPFSRGEPDERFLAAAERGSRLLLTRGGEPINAQTCLISTGRTDDLSPISPSTALPCDVGAKGFESRAAYTPEEVRRALHKKGALSADCSEWFSDAVYADNGTLLYVSFNGERTTGAALRRALGLRSTAITVEFTEDKFFFGCLGCGENKGMSINAADHMAITGSTAEEILALFYPGAELKKCS